MPMAQAQKDSKTFKLTDFEVLTTLGTHHLAHCLPSHEPDTYDFQGTGTFGRVRLVKHLSDSKHFALKILKKSEILRLKQVEHIKSEVMLLKRIMHPFIVNL